MDPDAALRLIDEARRVDAETREVMHGLHAWLTRGGFAPDWTAYPKGTRRFRKVYGGSRKAGAHATKKDPAETVIKLKDRNRGHVWLTVRDGIVVGAMGSEPKRYVGMTLDQAKHVARYGGTVSKSKSAMRHDHAVVAHAGTGSLQIGDIVQRADVNGKNRYVIVNIQPPWIYTRRISGSGGPGVITFPSQQMLKKVSS